MELAKEELSQIKDLLRKNPRGMNVTEIAKEIGINRVTAAKYLDMLVLTGHVDLKEWGPSKVYFISQRMPISAMLSLSSDLIMVLDKDMNIMNVNDSLLAFTGMSREELFYKKIQLFAIPSMFKPSFMPRIKDAIDGKESVAEARYEKNGETHYVNVKLIPIVFEEGEKGVTILIEDITERKMIEQAIRESEEKFHSVIEQSVDGIMLIDNDGAIIECSKGVEYITGIKPWENIGKKLWETAFISNVTGEHNSDYKTKAGLKNLEKFILEYVRTGVSPLGISSFELTFTKPDNEKRVVLFNYSPIKSDKGNMLCTIARDITERKKAEEMQTERESKLKKILDVSPVPMVITDNRAQKTVYINAKFTETFGYTIEDIPTASEWFYLAYPDLEYRSYILRNWTKQMSEASRKKTGHTTKESIVACKDGSKRIVITSTSSMDDQTILVFQDITEQKQVEGALRRAEERYRNMVECVSDIIWETDASFVITYVNHHASDALGLRPEDILGKTTQELMTPEEGMRFTSVITPYASARKPFSRLVFKYLGRDGKESEAEVSGTPIIDAKGEFRGYRGVTRSIADRRQ
jgi:PAS domain S-box-containing protein